MAAPVLLLFFFFFFTLPPPSLLQSVPTDFINVIYQDCLRNSSSSLTATFSRNLDIALANFSTMASKGTNYSTATIGVPGTDPVYAAFQCRGDLAIQSCSVCVQNATSLLPQACPKSVEARIQLEGCFLHYDNRSFFSLDTNVKFALCNTQNTSNTATLTAIQDVMGRVVSLAPAQGGFASDVENGVYAEAQCIGYINSYECSQCLNAYPYRTFCDSSVGKRIYVASCFYRFEVYNFMDTLPSPPPPPPAPPPLAVSPAGAPPVLLPAPSTNSNGARFESLESSLPEVPVFGRAFSLQELQLATQGFHPNNKIGEGGFGIVYKGTLMDGQELAVKRITIGNQARKEEFLNEVKLITSVQHKNLIQLLGCCVEDSQRILVYEYLPNQSLDGFLFGAAQKKNILDWKTRYEIILGMAKGLAYLHEESHYRIIHRDIKASNILLDNQLRPVIADFGLAKLVKADASHMNTRVAGTIGYLAPEYAIHGELSENVDVFSFGVVCLEIITAMQNKNGRLLKLVWEHYECGNVADIVDKSLSDAFSMDEVIRVVHISLLCIQENPKQRPAMSSITLWLSGTSDILDKPNKPAFLDYSTPPSSSREQVSSMSTSSANVSSGAEKSTASGGVLDQSEIDPR